MAATVDVESDCESSSLLCGEVAWDGEDENASSNFDGGILASGETEAGALGCGRTGELFVVIAPDLGFVNEDTIRVLIQKETDHLPRHDYLQRYRNRLLDVTARRDAISWIYKVQAYYNFRPLTAYLSVNYLDRFLSSYEIPQGASWLLQLLSVACMSLAAKMEETEVPLVSDLQVDDTKPLVEARTIRRMELLVMSQLKWRLRSITPFSFVDYYLYSLKFNNPVPRALISRVTDLIVKTNRVIDFLLHKPSAVAGAAVLCSLDEFLPHECADHRKALFCVATVDKESILDCYELMQELVVDLCSTSAKAVRSSPVPQSPAGVLDAATCISCDSIDVTDGSLRMSKRRKTTNFDPLLCMAEDNGWP